MKLLKANIPQTCEIVLHGDSHEGNVACHQHGLNELIAWIKAKRNRYFVHVGDEIEAITTNDKRFQHDTNDQPIPIQQMLAVQERYRPIANRCLVWLWGNHSAALKAFGNLTEMLCANLGVPYGTWSCKLDLWAGERRVCKMFLTHGGRGQITSNAKDFEQQQANMKASLKRRLIHKAADCLIMACGHYHRLIVVDPAKRLILRDDGEKLTQSYLEQGDGSSDYIEPDSRFYACTGSFLRTFAMDVSTYSEQAGYDPVELGYVVVSIRKGAVVDVRPIVIG